MRGIGSCRLTSVRPREAHEGYERVRLCERRQRHNDTGAIRLSVLGRQPHEGHSTGDELRDHLRGMLRFGLRITLAKEATTSLADAVSGRTLGFPTAR